MGFLVGDQIDNKTEAHVAASVRIAALGLAAGALGVGLGFVMWGWAHL